MWSAGSGNHPRGVVTGRLALRPHHPTSTATAPHRSAMTADRGAAVFTGRVRLVRIDLAAEDLDHLSTPEERLYLAMARAVLSLPPRLDRKHEWRSTSE